MGGLFRQILLVISGLGALMAHAQNLTGVVFEDSNKNGVQDVGEPGCPDIVVSNQIEVAVTNEAGRFHTLALAGHFHIRESLMFQEDGVSTRVHQGAAMVGPVPMGEP